MKSKKHILPGPFVSRDLGTGLWQLTRDSPLRADIFVKATGAASAGLLDGSSISAVELVWRDDGVTLTLTGAHGMGCLQATSAIVHQPDERLYDSLPLASFDAAARRFWKRVFGLMRIPGGRFFLGYIARRNR